MSSFLRLFLLALVLLVGRFLFLHVPFSDDDLTHFDIAQDALGEPKLFLDIWGRPGFTLLHALPAQLGYLGCAILSALLSVAGALLVARLYGSRAGLFAGLGFAACFFQPQFYFLADAVLTETVYAFFLALALYLISRGETRWACLALSWGAITRLEGMPMLPIYALGLYLDDRVRRPQEARDWKEQIIRLLILGSCPVLWNLVYAFAIDFRSWLPIYTENVFVTAPKAYYGQGSWYSYLLEAGNIHGPAFAVLALFGCLALLRRRHYFVPLSLTAFWVMQSALWASGHYRSGGYNRFFVSITPIAAVAIVAGFRLGIARGRRCLPGRGLRAAILAVLAFSVLWCATKDYLFKSQRMRDEAAAAQALEFIEESGGVGPERLVYGRDIRAQIAFEDDHLRPLSSAALKEARPGSLILAIGHLGPDRPFDLRGFLIDDAEVDLDFRDVDTESELGPSGARSVLRYRELADYSIPSNWPYYVKVLEIVPN